MIYKEGEGVVFSRGSRVRFKRDVAVASPGANKVHMKQTFVKAGALGTITDILPYVVVSIDSDDANVRKQIAWHQSINLSDDIELVDDGLPLVVDN